MENVEITVTCSYCSTVYAFVIPLCFCLFYIRMDLFNMLLSSLYFSIIHLHLYLYPYDILQLCCLLFCTDRPQQNPLCMKTYLAVKSILILILKEFALFYKM